MRPFSFKKLIFTIVLFTLAYCNLFANEPSSGSGSSSKEVYNPVPSIMHHISDSHEWHLWGENEGAFTIPLPVILYTEGNLDIFLSSDFHHGHSKVTKENRTYSINHHDHIIEESGLPFIDFSITKNVASMIIGLFVLLLLFGTSGLKAKKNIGAPSGILSFLEPLVLFVRDDIVKPNIGKNYNKYLPYLLTLFFFILVNNLLGLLPGSANVTGNIVSNANVVTDLIVGRTSSVTITGVTPGGTSGGDLAGTYPNPTLAQKGATSGQVLKYNGSSWAPAADLNSGGGGAGATIHRFKLNYNSSGQLDTTSNLTSLINSVSIDSASGGDVTVTFDSSITMPPASVMMYGYDYTNNKYSMVPAETTMALREIAGGGSSGSPTLFDGGSSIALKLRLRETETGASRSFGTVTHAWVQFVIYD